MSLTPELYEIIVKIIDERVKEIKVTREEFDKLRENILELTKSVNRLAEAQARTEERVTGLEEAVKTLAEAQARTEERVTGLEEAVKTLAEAQARTEQEVGNLSNAIRELSKEVGRLSDTIGFGLEDICKVVLPGWLYRHLGIKINKLDRAFFITNGERIEINAYGEGFLNDEKIAIIAESKSRIHESDVNKFYYEIFKKVEQILNIKCIGVLFGYLIYPEASELAKKLNLYTVASYER